MPTPDAAHHHDGTSRFAGRVAIVTGAANGVGRATARRFAQDGAAVVVADLDGTAADRTAADIVAAGGRAIAVEVDVADEAAIAAMVAVAVDRFGRLDILHNNAAALGADVYPHDLTIESLSLDVWNRTLDVNATGVLLGCKHAVPALRACGGGAIVNTASVAALHGGDDHAAYGTSKAAVVAITRYVASMYGPDRIRCNAVAPGLIMSETAAAALSPAQLAEFAAERGLPWAAEPEDIADIVAWLASDDSRCVTGQTIVADSGLIVRRPRDVIARWERRRPRGADVKFGFMVPRESDFADAADPYERIYDYCQRAEELGFDFATFTHHRFSPDRPYLSSPLILMAAIAARTSTLELVTTVFVLPLYHPLDVAEAVATLDLVAGGRVVFGVGAGYREYEATAVGVPFDRRVGRMAESMEVLRRAWTGEPLTFHGQHFAFDDVVVVPKPPRTPPIWLGALEPRPVARAGRIADGWIAPYLQTLTTLGARAELYRAAAAEHDRPATICLERDVVLAADADTARGAWLARNEPLIAYYRAQGASLPDFPAGDTSFAARSAGCAIAGDADECIRELRRCETELGCEYLSLMNIGTGPGCGHRGNYEHELAALERFGRDVIPAFR